MSELVYIGHTSSPLIEELREDFLDMVICIKAEEILKQEDLPIGVPVEVLREYFRPDREIE